MQGVRMASHASRRILNLPDSIIGCRKRHSLDTYTGALESEARVDCPKNCRMHDNPSVQKGDILHNNACSHCDEMGCKRAGSVEAGCRPRGIPYERR